MDLVEVYVLAAERTAASAEKFLQAFLPLRQPGAVDFPFPQFVDQPEHVYATPEEVIERLERKSTETYALYWDDSRPKEHCRAMLFFTSDAAMIVGLVVPEHAAVRTFSEVAAVVGGRFGYLSGDSPPPETQDEFIRLCRRANRPCLVDGELRQDESR